MTAYVTFIFYRYKRSLLTDQSKVIISHTLCFLNYIYFTYVHKILSQFDFYVFILFIFFYLIVAHVQRFELFCVP